MNRPLLKLIALLSMMLDHISYVWMSSSGITEWGQGLRMIGRTAFPIFSFFLIQGWRNTHNRLLYTRNLILCALFSQIPFSLVFSNFPAAGRHLVMTDVSIDHLSGQIAFDFDITAMAAGVCLMSSLWLVHYRTGGSVSGSTATLTDSGSVSCSTATPSPELSVGNKCILVIGFILPAFSLSVGEITFLSEELNVVYTLLLGMPCFYAIDLIKTNRSLDWDSLLLSASTVLAIFAIGPRVDFGIAGLCLIVLLYVLPENKFFYSPAIALWGMVYSGLIRDNWPFALGTLLPAALILFYDYSSENRKTALKRLFYIFYPAHLLILGLIHVL